jgi:hypothetical protein
MATDENCVYVTRVQSSVHLIVPCPYLTIVNRMSDLVKENVRILSQTSMPSGVQARQPSKALYIPVRDLDVSKSPSMRLIKVGGYSERGVSLRFVRLPESSACSCRLVVLIPF